MSDKYLDKEQFIFLPKSCGLPILHPVLHEHKRHLIDVELVVITNANLVPRFFPSGRKSQSNLFLNELPFYRKHSIGAKEKFISSDSMSDSEGNKKQIKRVTNCIFKFT